MLFNSLQYLVFFPVVFILYFLIPQRYRWVFLLAASYYFYMCWKVEYILLIIASTIIDYIAGIKMGKTQQKKKRKKYLMLSLFTNLGLLFAFKYFNFFNDSLRLFFQKFNVFYGVPAFNVLLPVGISFYTFQTLSYTIDVYRGIKKPEKHFGIFALYVAFFPQLVAGPIERSTHLLPQFYEKHSFNYERIVSGLRLMLWGFFKKIVIADRLAVVVDVVYNDPINFQGMHFVIATIFFAFQIYCDFSAYSDIAIGTARTLGFNLMSNFDRPYFAKSIPEFWKRWHISLSTWFKDYLYIPLGGNRVSVARRYLNLLIVFVVSGLWHGANWTFVIWGLLHGMYMIFSVIFKKVRKRIVKLARLENSLFLLNILRQSVTFALVCFSWIFFRAKSLNDALYIITHLFAGLSGIFKEVLCGNLGYLYNMISCLEITKIEFILSLTSIVFLLCVHFLQRSSSIDDLLSNLTWRMRWGIYYAFIFSIFFVGCFGKNEFIYFQF